MKIYDAKLIIYMSSCQLQTLPTLEHPASTLAPLIKTALCQAEVRLAGGVRYLVNAINLHRLPASCNCTGSDVLLIRISTKFDLDLCVTFLNFKAGSIWEDIVNVITFRRLPISCCNFMWMFST